MKRILFLPLLLLGSTITFSQQTPAPTTPSPAKQDYLKKSRTQKVIAFCLLGGGIITWLAGASKNMNQNDNVDGGGETAMVIGGVAAASSIPLFIMASKNKKKAMSLTLNRQVIPQLQQANYVHQILPSLNVKLNL